MDEYGFDIIPEGNGCEGCTSLERILPYVYGRVWNGNGFERGTSFERRYSNLCDGILDVVISYR